jgi:hypothetical protein
METQRADPGLRRTAALVFLALVLVGAAGLVALQIWLSGLAQPAAVSSQGQLLAAFAGLVGTACVSLLALAVYLWRTAGRVLAAGQFPPPGMRVVRDTPVLRGTKALRRGRIIQGVSVVLVLCCFAFAATAWRVHSVLFNHAV